MILSAEKAILIEAVTTASRAVSTKSTIPALEGILFDAGNEGLFLSGYNLETGICTRIDADIRTPGRIVIQARLLGEIIRKLPDDVITIESDEKFLVSIRCGTSDFSILGTTPEDFPELPVVEKNKSIKIIGTTLADMIDGTIFAVSTNENKPVHTGSLFEIEENTLNVVSVDGYRMAICREEIASVAGDENFTFVIPAAALKETARIVRDFEGEAEIDLGGRHAIFTMGETTLVCRLLDGEFLNYRSSLSQNVSLSMKIDRRRFLDCIERVSLVANERIKSPVRLEAGDGIIKLHCAAALGRAYDECPAEGEGEGVEIGFNNRYLIEALRVIPDDDVIIDFSSPLHPCIVRPCDGNAWLHLILPVRLK